ncbi:hypothetical protein MRB53_034085 [Persea americana]|uniref:Uncharacterized protein n=1 Tax=Persea americana TaxID=3435 RepID=A0ACC2KWV4_PERAE|nr:hypothetical protein MRB53_034085 [Persea americana]
MPEAPHARNLIMKSSLWIEETLMYQLFRSKIILYIMPEDPIAGIGSTTIPKSKDNMAEAHSDRIVTDWKARFYCRRADDINLLNSLHPD